MNNDRKLSELYRSGDRPQPPEALDEMIRLAARRPGPSRRAPAVQWIGGVAATVLVGLLVVQLMPVSEQQAVQQERLPAAPARAPADSLLEKSADRAPVTEPAGAARMLAPAAPRRQVNDTRPTGQLSADQAAETQGQEPDQADARLEQISALLDAGRYEAALEALHALQTGQPDLEIPAELKARLESIKNAD